MGHALLAYSNSAVGVNAVNTDLTAATDPDFSQRNNHLIFTEQYRMLATALIGASVTKGRFQVPTWNAVGEFDIFAANRSAGVPSNPLVDDWKAYPPPVPQMEEFQIQVSGNLGAATERDSAAIIVATDDWSANLPPGRLPILTNASFTVTPTAGAWSGGQAITLNSNLRGGVYAVVGAELQGANSIFFRLIFPRYRLYHGRKLRPGWLVQNAVGDVPNIQQRNFPFMLGEWGRFHTFELPQVEVFGTTAGSITYQLFLWMIFLGESIDQLNQGLGGGM